MAVFFDELRAKTGITTTAGLCAAYGGVRAVDSTDVGSEGVDDPPPNQGQRVWYAWERGDRIPRPEFVRHLHKKVPGLIFDVHHPVLRWLGAPHLVSRSVRRLAAEMPAKWHNAVKTVKAVPNNGLLVGSDLVESLKLYKLNYLDSVFLFAWERQQVALKGDEERVAKINLILWALPALYPDDLFWNCESREALNLGLRLIDQALALDIESDAASPTLYRTGWIRTQQWDFECRLRRFPKGLQTPIALRRFFARRWRDPASDFCTC